MTPKLWLYISVGTEPWFRLNHGCSKPFIKSHFMLIDFDNLLAASSCQVYSYYRQALNCTYALLHHVSFNVRLFACFYGGQFQWTTNSSGSPSLSNCLSLHYLLITKYGFDDFVTQQKLTRMSCGSVFAAQCYASAAYAVTRCLSVCLSIRFVNSVKTNNSTSQFFYYQVAASF